MTWHEILQTVWGWIHDGYVALGSRRCFTWRGPQHKSTSAYFTHEGWYAGTECWYVVVDIQDWRLHFFDLTPEAVIERAWRWVEPAYRTMMAGGNVGRPTPEEYGHYDVVMADEEA